MDGQVVNEIKWASDFKRHPRYHACVTRFPTADWSKVKPSNGDASREALVEAQVNANAD